MRVHYGLTASGNQVIKDAAFRDRLNLVVLALRYPPCFFYALCHQSMGHFVAFTPGVSWHPV